MEINTQKISTHPERFPAYLRYDSELAPQPAYLTLDKRDGEMDVYIKSISGGMPEDVWAGHVAQYRIDPGVTRDELLGVIDMLRDELTAQLDDDSYDDQLCDQLMIETSACVAEIPRVLCDEDVHTIVAESDDVDDVLAYIVTECKTHYTYVELSDMILAAELD